MTQRFPHLRSSMVALIVAAGMLMSSAPPAVAQAERPAIPSPSRAAPVGAPNVIVILGDDVGFSMNSTFGGPVPTPHFAALAQRGLIYNRFHTTAQCSPTRAALLTGRNPHRVNMGALQNLSDNNPGFTSIIPKSAASIGRVLQLNGYGTAWFGKNHITPDWELTAAGPFDRWPTGLGFDYFYGFNEGWTDQFQPALVEGTKPVAPPATEGYILERDLADRAIAWVREQTSIAPQRPFFLYFATGAVHSPQQAPEEWIARFRGKFDMGWDALRQQTFARQKAAGIIPADAALTPRPAALPAWDSLTPEQRTVAARMMEVAAAQSAFFDDQMGRVFATLKETGRYENTLIIYINGDNGATEEGLPDGSFARGGPGALKERLTHLDRMGGPLGGSLYNAGWGWAMNTPFPYWKQISSHLGGIRNGLLVSWPSRILAPGVRSQFSFVTDVAPTIFEAAGIKPPAQVDGIRQMPLDGASLVASFNNPETPSKHVRQYFEINGHRAMYDNGWLAGTTPPVLLWENKQVPPVATWKWELYHLDKDYSQFENVAAKYPEKLRKLQRAFDRAASDNGFALRQPPRPGDRSALARTPVRPYWMNGRTRFRFYPSENRMMDSAFPSLGMAAAWSVAAKIELPSTDTSGAIISQGSGGIGWSLSLDRGRPTFIYSTDPFAPRRMVARASMPPGAHEVEVRFASLAAGGGRATLLVDGHELATMAVPTVIRSFPYSGIGLGRTFGGPLPEGAPPVFAFGGMIEHIDVALDDGRSAN